jgi:hypothetical protein
MDVSARRAMRGVGRAHPGGDRVGVGDRDRVNHINRVDGDHADTGEERMARPNPGPRPPTERQRRRAVGDQLGDTLVEQHGPTLGHPRETARTARAAAIVFLARGTDPAITGEPPEERVGRSLRSGQPQ